MQLEKLCKGCQVVKPAQDFHKNHSYSDGCEPSCKACKAAADAARRQRLVEEKLDSNQVTVTLIASMKLQNINCFKLSWTNGRAKGLQKPTFDALLPFSSIFPGAVLCKVCISWKTRGNFCLSRLCLDTKLSAATRRV